MDQLVSGQLGFIPQITRSLNGNRIVGATIFLDSYSNSHHVYLMRLLDASEKLDVQVSFERVLQLNRVSVKEY